MITLGKTLYNVKSLYFLIHLKVFFSLSKLQRSLWFGSESYDVSLSAEPNCTCQTSCQHPPHAELCFLLYSTLTTSTSPPDQSFEFHNTATMSDVIDFSQPSLWSKNLDELTPPTVVLTKLDSIGGEYRVQSHVLEVGFSRTIHILLQLTVV